MKPSLRIILVAAILVVIAINLYPFLNGKPIDGGAVPTADDLKKPFR
jgi:hypothetical protein